MIGTTHFTNAVVERRRLDADRGRPARRCPPRAALPPMVDWPDDLREALGGHVYLAHGGHEFDGRRDLAARPGELRRIAARHRRARDLRSVAISSVFSPVNAEFELEAAELLAARAARCRGHQPLARDRPHRPARARERDDHERLPAAARRPTSSRPSARRWPSCGIEAPVYLSQNDGTLMSVEYAERYPVATFASGPDELDARRGVPVRPRRLRGRRHRRHDRRRRHARSTASRARRRSRSTSAACARTSACPTCSRSASAAAAWSMRTRAERRPAAASATSCRGARSSSAATR